MTAVSSHGGVKKWSEISWAVGLWLLSSTLAPFSVVSSLLITCSDGNHLHQYSQLPRCLEPSRWPVPAGRGKTRCQRAMGAVHTDPAVQRDESTLTTSSPLFRWLLPSPTSPPTNDQAEVNGVTMTCYLASWRLPFHCQRQPGIGSSRGGARSDGCLSAVADRLCRFPLVMATHCYSPCGHIP